VDGLLKTIRDPRTKNCCLGKLAQTLPTDDFSDHIPEDIPENDKSVWENVAETCKNGAKACATAVHVQFQYCETDSPEVGAQ
jgi:hypothetical protein